MQTNFTTKSAVLLTIKVCRKAQPTNYYLFLSDYELSGFVQALSDANEIDSIEIKLLHLYKELLIYTDE